MKGKVVLAGGSGFLGQALADHLKRRGYTAVILTRGSSADKNGITYVHWDGRTLDDSWVREIDGSYAIVNFTGKSVNCLYTKKNREEIIASRLDSVSILKEAVRKSSAPPQAFIQAGSLAIFGDTADVCDEDAAHGDGFSVSVCQQWEEAFFSETLPKTRQVMLRIGFALGKGGGALGPLQMLARYGLGGPIGSGRQYISWLHMEDLNAMFMESIENEDYKGIFNATGTGPVTNKEFMRVLRKVMNKGWAPPAPATLVKLGAYMIMRADPSLALTGRNCIPKKLLHQGFKFKYTNLEAALRDLM
jgi:uncharacterized protein (TIGR01777 family)